MSDPAKPSDQDPADPAPAPAAPNAEGSASPLEIMPESTPLATSGPAGVQTPPDQAEQPGQALVVVPPGILVPTPPGAPPPGGQPAAGGPSPAPATPIDYAMPSSKTWIPSPALIKNLGCIFKMLFGFTIMLGVGYFMLMALNPKARQWALQGSQKGPDGLPVPGAHGPTPFKFVNQILAMPAQALAKTDDVVKANNARAGVVDGLVAEEEGKLKGETARRAATNPFANGGAASPETKQAGPASPAGTATADPAADERAALAARMMALAEKGGGRADAPKADAVRPTAIAAPTTDVLPPITLPGGIVIQNASPEGAPPASRTFFYWVVNASISGVTSGPPARLLVGGRLAYEGSEIYIPLGIVFERLDPATKVLYFRDQTGAVVTRSY